MSIVGLSPLLLVVGKTTAQGETLLDALQRTAKERRNRQLTDQEYPHAISELTLAYSPAEIRAAAVLSKRMGAIAECELLTVHLDPNEEVALHDHPDETGVMCCLRGTVTVDSFTRCSDALNGACVIEQVGSNTLRVGGRSVLGPTFGNIHRLRASSECEIIDIFTPPFTGERSAKSHNYVLGPALQGLHRFQAFVV